MEKFKKLFHVKRILAMILATAMVVTMIPNTVYASTGTEEVQVQEESADIVKESVDTNLAAEGETPAAPVYSIIDEIAVENKKAVYNGGNPFDMDTIFSSIQVLKDGEYLTSAYDVYYGYDETGLFSQVNLTWQKEGTDGIYANTDVVANAGNYKLLVDFIGVDGTASVVNTEVAFVIEKAPLYPYVELAEIVPGSKVSDVKIVYASLANADGEVILESASEGTSPLTYKVVSFENANKPEEIFTDDDVLVNTKNYVVNVEITIAETVNEPNYEVPAVMTVRKDVYIGDSFYTELEVQLGETWRENGYISYTYTGKAITEPVKDTDYTVKVKYDNGNEYTYLENAVVEGIWYDENDNLLENAPTDAGTYYYSLCYKGEEGIYYGSSYSIQVVVNQSVLTIVPKFNEDAAFYTGTTVKEVLDKVDYTVYEGEQELQIDRSYFWGVSNSDSYYDRNYTQSYEPSFRVQQIVKDENTGDISYVNLNDWDILNKENSYRVIFTGRKCVYYRDWADGSSENINYTYCDCANDNYKVDDSSKTLEEKTVVVEVRDGVAAEININALLGTDNVGKTKENPIKSVYNGNNLFASRNDYKKAVVVTKDGNDTVVAETTDKSITYLWYEYNEYEEDYVQVSLALGSPINAGNYKLVISYDDSANYYHADSVEVFYTIEKQKVYVYGYGEYTAYTGKNIYEFIEYSYIDNFLTIIPENGVEELFDISIYYYNVYWAAQKSTDGENWTTITDENEVFVKDTFYRLVPVDLEFNTNTYSRNYIFAEPVRAALVNVVEMGTAELTVTVDETKLTAKSKVYDGKPINIYEDIYSGAILIGDGITEIPYELGCYWLKDNTEIVEAPVDAGTYTFYMYFEGNEKYKPFEYTKEIVTLTISPKEINVIPAVKDSVIAGAALEEIYNLAGTVFETPADVDAEAFIYANYGWEAIANIEFGVYNSDNELVNSVAGNRTYELAVVSANLKGEFAENYTLNLEETVTFTTDRGTSTVKHASADVIEAVKVKDKVEGMTHTITPESAIPYLFNGFNGYSGEVTTLDEGNLIAIEIIIPKEYEYIPDTALYHNSINEAGGVIYEVTEKSIIVVFNAEAKDKKEFSIRWEEGYLEKFVVDFTNVSLMPNLHNAVAPKSISFISPVKKMVVGGEQQLDVKLTKVQESDLICLTYAVDNDEILYVDEYGYVTALAKGSATVTVYPSKVAGSELVPIEGAKTASVKITVNDVTAPKISKVLPLDTSAEVIFGVVGDGYRREVYVLEGKDRKVEEFEAAIDSMNNGIWEGIFASAPIYNEYYYDRTNSYNELDGLEAATDYTVYVRNVSKIRDVENIYGEASGYHVSESAAGTVKSFKTTKNQIDELYILLNYGDLKYDYLIGTYTIPLSKGSTTFYAEGRYEEADGSYVEARFPLSSELKGEYESPKLVYGVYDMNGGQTSIATIDKSGKLTLKGVGTILVEVYDSNTGCYDLLPVTITADADSFSGKTANLKLGESVNLEELVTYKEGKKVLTGDYKGNLVIDAELEQIFAENEYFKLDGTTVTAVKTGGTLVIHVKDANIPDAVAAITLKSGKALDPVKNLKSTMVTDQYIDLQFTHDGYAEAFRIEVTDASGNIIHSVYAPGKQINVEENIYEYRISGLTKKSKYNVTVTALYGDETSKIVKKSFTTTLLPASYVVLDENAYGGVEIIEMTLGYSLGDDPLLVTGNTYTLHTEGMLVNASALYWGTDTLTWSSSNKKVATVKANKSTFGASMTAVGQGYTTIEVKSKITKAVIARYEIYIYAVGDAYYYYGTNEPDNFKNEVNGTDIDLDRRPVYEEYAVSARSGKYAWITFTAPYSGTYSFESSGSSDVKGWFFTDKSVGNNASSGTLNYYAEQYGYGYDDDSSEEGNNFYKEIYLEKGTTIYIAVGHYSLGSAVNTTVMIELE